MSSKSNWSPSAVATIIASSSILLSSSLLMLQLYKTRKAHGNSYSETSLKSDNGTKLNLLILVAFFFLLLSDICQLSRAFFISAEDNRSIQIFLVFHTGQAVSNFIAVGIYAVLTVDRLGLFSQFIPKQLNRPPGHIRILTALVTFLSTITFLGAQIHRAIFIDNVMNPLYYQLPTYLFYIGCLTYFVVRQKIEIMNSITPLIQRQLFKVQVLVILNLMIMLSSLGIGISLREIPALFGVSYVCIRICFAVELVLLDGVRKVSQLGRAEAKSGVGLRSSA
ncbi:hypothetical protein BKA69DRAFT_1049904 [Paraphysoderma sedebokerense]|nr:hypothetical protein BKA69DRAFT_1049904 [Paraphysoderma sedebokerense]